MSKYFSNSYQLFFGCIFVIILSVPAIIPFFHRGFFPIHDDAQVARVYEMHKSLADGMFPVRWVEDLGYGYGYPIFNFYAPLAYYVGGGVDFVMSDTILATKIMMILGIIFSGITMFFLGRMFWGFWGGIISAMFYVYAPYHALNIYVRGAVGEYYAYAFLPLAVYGFIKVFQTNRWMYIAIAALGYAGIVLSHNLTAFMATPFLCILIFVLFVIHYRKTKKIQFNLLWTFLLGIGISAFYWLPVIFEMKYTDVLSQVGGGSDFKDHFVCLRQLWDSPWGYAGSTQGCIADGMSFRLGKLHIIFSFLLLGLLPYSWIKDKNIFGVLLFSFVGLVISIFLSLEFSRFFWELIPPFSFFQFPWRFLLLSSFFASFLAGGIVLYVRYFLYDKKKQNICITIIACIIIIVTIKHYIKVFIPQSYISKNYLSEYELKWLASKTSDEYLPKDFPVPNTYSDISKNSINNSRNEDIVYVEKKTQKIVGTIALAQPGDVVFPIAYFPGWNVFIDEKIHPYKAKEGKVSINLPKGSYDFRLEFIQTPIEKAGNLISFISILILVIGIIRFRKRAYEKR